MSYADPARLTQIIGNLLHNASKFTPQGGQVTVELTRENDVAIVRVIDSGDGIPPDQLRACSTCSPDPTGRMATANSGLGIGLALSRRLAKCTTAN